MEYEALANVVVRVTLFWLLTTSLACARRGPTSDHGRPVEEVARDLGVTPDQFRQAFNKVRPAPRGQRPTRAQRETNRRVLSRELGVSPEKLDEVMDRYRPRSPQKRAVMFAVAVLSAAYVLHGNPTKRTLIRRLVAAAVGLLVVGLVVW